jgi:hypothetical protein
LHLGGIFVERIQIHTAVECSDVNAFQHKR